MKATELPRVLRTKRKRGDDPLEALIIEDSNSSKRPKLENKDIPVEFYYKLSRTDEMTEERDASIVKSILSEIEQELENNDGDDSLSTRKRKFFLSKKKKTLEDLTIPYELTDMLTKYLSVNSAADTRYNIGTSRGKVDKGGSRKVDATSESDVTSDYVFDVYYLSKENNDTIYPHDYSRIGYVSYFDEEETFNISENEKDSNGNLFSDDEDSNAESFYQNDYPSDEDAENDGFSDEEYLDRSASYEDYYNDEGYSSVHRPANSGIDLDDEAEDTNEFDGLYDHIYRVSHDQMNILSDEFNNDNDDK